jgi:hypothetical protein
MDVVGIVSQCKANSLVSEQANKCGYTATNFCVEKITPFRVR